MQIPKSGLGRIFGQEIEEFSVKEAMNYWLEIKNV